jgi:hypothetical protein
MAPGFYMSKENIFLLPTTYVLRALREMVDTAIEKARKNGD